ncbi:MAG: response regulator, partial [Gammaproteobacteria bacterium]|nr:response regulator [Gammaproteobacteria bacterium]
SLSDTGTGISDEEQEHIFEPFFTTKPVGKGTGLGLSMVFGFINRSQGYIEVCSRPGIGATFNLYLPRARAKQQYNDITDRQADEMLKGDELILVVDDEPGLLELAQDSLSSQGYRVLIASNGKQALELLVNNPGISLLFSDIVMPGGMSGYDLAERASAVHPDLKVLLTSGHTEKEGHHVRGKYNLLKKPYSHEALAYQVRSFLDE